MANIDAKTVNDLRLETGAGMMDCKKALEEAGGDKNKAKEILKKKGLEKADNIAAKGSISPSGSISLPRSLMAPTSTPLAVISAWMPSSTAATATSQ